MHDDPRGPGFARTIPQTPYRSMHLSVETGYRIDADVACGIGFLFMKTIADASSGNELYRGVNGPYFDRLCGMLKFIAVAGRRGNIPRLCM